MAGNPPGGTPIPFGQRLEGLLGSPGFNIGLGLLAAAGERPVGANSSLGARLLEGVQLGQQGIAAAGQLEAQRERVLQRQQQQRLASDVQSFIAGVSGGEDLGLLGDPSVAGGVPGESAPGFVGPPQGLQDARAVQSSLARITPQQKQLLQLVARQDPAAALQIVGSLIGLGPQQQQQSASPVGRMLDDLEIAERRGDQRATTALRSQIDAALAGTDSTFDDVRSARNDTIKNSQTFLAAQSGFERVQAGFASGSPAGDIAGVFGFMKTIDPSSVVRENEFATIENAGSIPERIRGLYNRLLRGERLTPDQRQDFTAQAQAQFAKAIEAQQRLVDDATGFAERNSLRVSDVVPEFVIPRAMQTIAPPERGSVLNDAERAELEQLRRQLGFN